MEEHEGNNLWHGVARHEPLCPANARQHGTPVHPDYDGRYDRRSDPAAILQPATPAVRCAADFHLEATLAARERCIRRNVLGATTMSLKKIFEEHPERRY